MKMKTLFKKKCDECGKKYKTYPIILDNNPLSISSFIEQIQNEDGSLKRLCKECWDKKKEAD